MIFFSPSTANGLFVNRNFLPSFYCFSCLVLFETLLISPKEGPNTSLSLSLPADYNLKPPFPIADEQEYV